MSCCSPSCTPPTSWSGSVRSPTQVTCRRKGGAKTGPSLDRGRLGSKHHLLVDGGGVPLAWTLTGGNRNDVTQLLVLLDRVPPVRWPRRPPTTPTADADRRSRL